MTWTTAARRLPLAIAAIAVVAAVSAGPAGAARQLHYKTPSGNINCYLFAAQGGVADCMVRKASWPNVPKKPASCDLDWAPYEVQLVKSHVTLGGCRGDIGPLCYGAGDPCSVLAYGHHVTMGGITCSSAATGLTCRRTAGTRAGFRVARENVTVYH
jgi:hypothetical protein